MPDEKNQNGLWCCRVGDCLELVELLWYLGCFSASCGERANKYIYHGHCATHPLPVWIVPYVLSRIETRHFFAR